MFIEHFCLFFSGISCPINISCEHHSAARILAVLVLLVVLPCWILTWFISYQFCALQTLCCPPGCCFLQLLLSIHLQFLHTEFLLLPSLPLLPAVGF